MTAHREKQEDRGPRKLRPEAAVAVPRAPILEAGPSSPTDPSHDMLPLEVEGEVGTKWNLDARERPHMALGCTTPYVSLGSM